MKTMVALIAVAFAVTAHAQGSASSTSSSDPGMSGSGSMSGTSTTPSTSSPSTSSSSTSKDKDKDKGSMGSMHGDPHHGMHGAMAGGRCDPHVMKNADVKVENTKKGATIKLEAKDSADVSEIQAHARMMKDCMESTSMGSDRMRQGRSGSMSGGTAPSSTDTDSRATEGKEGPYGGTGVTSPTAPSQTRSPGTSTGTMGSDPSTSSPGSSSSTGTPSDSGSR